MRYRYVMHRVPEWEDGKVARMRYFGTATAAKKFAKDQAKTLGHSGHSMDSLPRDVVAELMTEHVPIPDHWLHASR